MILYCSILRYHLLQYYSSRPIYRNYTPCITNTKLLAHLGFFGSQCACVNHNWNNLAYVMSGSSGYDFLTYFV